MRLMIKHKVMGLAIVVAVLPILTVFAMTMIQKSQVDVTVATELDAMAKSQITQVAKDMYGFCETANALVQQKVNADLNVARHVLSVYGPVSQGSEPVTWSATNQLTQATGTITLPRMTVGGMWLGQNRDAAASTPVVDDIKGLTGGTCTIFQRMNDQGDMLRIATNVVQRDGSRAIGTYIPATNPDGSPNPVVSKVIRGETYRGRAQVVNEWYITAYEPLRDSKGQVVGMLFVGVKQESVESLRKAIMATTVGKTGYVYVLGGTGDQKGRYIISKDGARDGESIWEAKDADGRLFIQSIVTKALALKDKNVDYDRYPWKNDKDPLPRTKIAAITYFEPWDWVIGVGAYEDDFYDARTKVQASLGGLIRWMLGGGLVVLLAGVVLSYVVSRKVSRPIENMMQVADRLATGDISHQIDHQSHDETGRLADSFRNMMKMLKSKAEGAEALSRGDLSAEIEAVSDKDTLGHAMIKVKENVANMVTDANMLAEAAVEGHLDRRADASHHQGEYRKIVEGINSLISTLVGHIDSMPVPAVVIDRDFTIRFMNEVGARLGGKTKQQLVGTKCYDYFKTSDCNTPKCACGRAMSENRMASSETDAHPAGLNLEISYTGIPIRNAQGNVVAAFEVVHDQTAVKQAARLAKKSEDYMKVEVAKLTDNLGRMSEGNLEFTLSTETGDTDTAELQRNFQTIADAVNRSAMAVKTLVADTKTLANAAVEGNLETRADAEKHRGEYREIIRGINATLDAVLKPIQEASAVLEKVAARDLSLRMEGEYRGDHARIKEALNAAIQNLDEALSQMAVGAEQVASASGEISSGSQALAQGASEQASSLQEVSSSLQEMASMTKQNAANATEAKGMSDAAQVSATRGVDSMHRLSEAVEKIKASSDATAKILKTIDEIAFQTNLLALNAAVEAARAGDAGKGFAVVAEEVRNLAMRSAEAAKNTANMIEDSVKNADNGVQLNVEVLKNLDDINGQVMKVGEVMGEIAAASEQQSQGVDQINTAVEQMNQVTQQNAANSEESASAAEQLSGQSAEMKSIVSSFQLSTTRTASMHVNRRTTSGGHSVLTTAPKRAESVGTKGNGGHLAGRSRAATLIPFEEEKGSPVLQEF